jgi:hypothetical protein
MRAHTSRHLTALLLALAFGVAGCAAGSGGGSSARPAGSTADRIGRAELQEADNLDGLEAIQRLRRQWLQGRGGAMGASPVVLYIDGTKRQSLDDLRIYRTTEIQQIDYMNSNDATTRYGTGHGGGAIIVTLVR